VIHHNIVAPTLGLAQQARPSAMANANADSPVTVQPPSRESPMRRVLAALLLTLALPAALGLSPVGMTPLAAAGPCDGVLCAGAASVDMTWHVGGGQGQLGSAGNGLTADKFDPFHHSTKMSPTDGVQSRTFAKAIVVQGPDGTKVAYVKTELYLQQDILARRVAQLVTGLDPTAPELTVDGLPAGNIMLGGTHNHSVPHYTSTAAGVWIFADVFDIRAFDHTARRIAQAIRDAAAAMQPARVGASVTRVRDVQQNILGPAVADDGTPAGFPRDHFDDELAVVRFDTADGAEPIAALVNFAMHPESISGGADLISGDFIGVVERVVERALGQAVVAWSQSGLGDVEPDQSRASPPEAGRQYWRRDFAQAERMSRVLAGHVLRTWDDVAAGTPDIPDKYVPFSTDAAVDMRAYRFAGPATHPVATVSNCRTEWPGAPVLGFPDCLREGEVPAPYRLLVEQIRAAGVPVPDNYGVASAKVVQESLTIHLQTLRIGEILLGACPCEPVSDMALNFKSRADAVAHNQHLGYEWTCREGGETGVECDFRQAGWRAADWRPVDPDAHRRMVAQVRNDAAGWEDDVRWLQSGAEPTDPDEIYGNFTHDELDGTQGFTLPLMVGTANDYVGYVVTYREFQRGDHYRKALTPFGPHTADFINTRLVAMAAELRGGPSPQDALALLPSADMVAGEATAAGIGSAGTLAVLGYDTVIPDDGGTPGRPVAHPESVVSRFDAAAFTWEGGSTYTDNPVVVVQRRDGDAWRAVATQEGGEVVVTFAYDAWLSEAPVRWLTGAQPHRWTATFEVFEAIPPGTYRFAVEGAHRDGGAPVPYTTVSEVFEVVAWTGLVVTDLAVDRASGTASLAVAGHEAVSDAFVGPAALAAGQVRYPFTYEGGPSFIAADIVDHGAWRFCFRCTFRAWATHGTVTRAHLRITGPDGGVVRTALATLDPATGRLVASGLDLQPGEQVVVPAGAVRDEFGNTNASETYAQE
jgi:hypothetical protein